MATKKNNKVDEAVEEVEVITLEDENGKQSDFQVIATLDYKGETYAVLEEREEAESDSEDGEVLIFKIGEEDGDEVLLPIDDDELEEKVFNQFLKLMDSEK